MAELDKAGLKAQNDSLLPDNILQEIEPVDHRSVNSDVIDSCLNNTEASPQTIIGHVDFSGGVSSEGIELGSFENVVIINSLDDFPEPVLDSIELNPGVNTAYYIASKEIDISPYNLVCTGGSILIHGMHPAESQIISDTTEPLIDAIGCSLRVSDIILENPNGDMFGFAGDGVITGFLLDRVILNGCQYFAQNITGAVASSFNRLVVLSSSVGGFTFDGTTNSQLKLDDNAVGLASGFLNWTGNFIDLQTAEFDIIIATNNRVFPGVGDTFLTGAAAGANIKAGGSAILSGNLFDGDGNSVTTITGQDSGWIFDSNQFNDAVKNTMNNGDAYITAQETVTVSVQDTFYQINGGNWLSDVLANFTSDIDGSLEYTGDSALDVSIQGTATIEQSGGGQDIICMEIGIDTGSGYSTFLKTRSCTQNTNPTTVVCQGLFEISPGDKIALFVANFSDTSNIIVDASNLIVKG